MNERDRATGVAVLGKKRLKHFREPMHVNDQLAHPCRDQVIQRESNQWPLVNRDKRFGYFIGQRSQTRAESRAENESLRDGAHGDAPRTTAEQTVQRRASRQREISTPKKFALIQI